MIIKLIFLFALYVVKTDNVTSFHLNNKSEKTMNDTLNKLQQFETTIKAFCKPIADRFADGENVDFINSELGQLKIGSEELKILYRWKNGMKQGLQSYKVGEFDLFSQGKMLSLQEAVSHYKAYQENNLWNTRYFPLFTNGAGDYILYDTDKNSKTYRMLLIYSPGLLIVEPETIYDNLDTFLETLIVCYQNTIYKFEENTSVLIVDEELETQTSSRLNPRSQFWH